MVMDTFNAIPVFVAVADNAGFSSAARVLGISKSAVSKRITQLEQQLGARLFNRSTRHLSLTEAGERYYQYASQANRAAQQAQDAVSELQNAPKGLLKIQLPMTIGQMHLVSFIHEFMACYPDLEVDLTLGDRPINLIEEGYDLAIRAENLNDSTLIARQLVSLDSVVCVAPEFYAQHAKTLQHPSQLAECNCLLYSYSNNENVWQFTDKSNDVHKIKVSGNYRVNNSAVLKEAIFANMGVGRLPTFIAGPAIQQGQLVALFQEYEMPSKNLYAIYPARDYLPEKVRCFLDFMIEKLGNGKPHWDKF